MVEVVCCDETEIQCGGFQGGWMVMVEVLQVVRLVKAGKPAV